MIIKPPRGPQWVSWLLVVLWVGFIYYTIVKAGDIRKTIDQELGVKVETAIYKVKGGGSDDDRKVDQYSRKVVIYLVLAIAASGILCAIVVIVRNWDRYGWLSVLVLVALLFLYFRTVWDIYDSKKHSRWESMHFVQYGVLSVLVFRALAHRLRDSGIYLAAILLTAFIGTVDETVQWFTEGRYWDFHDLPLNGYSSLLALLVVGLGLRPAYLALRVGARSMRTTAVCGTLFLVFLGACCSNTADWLPFWEKYFPRVAEQEDPMAEYGFLYVDPELGSFKSRLTLAELKQQDETRAQEAFDLMPEEKAHMLDSKRYSAFLAEYNSVKDPWLHELRVHLFSRDKNEQRVREQIAAPKPDYGSKVAKMINEDKILWAYYPAFMELYKKQPDLTFQKEVEGDKEGKPYLSAVSKALITKISLGQIWTVIVALIALLWGLFAWRNKAEPQDAHA
jgi:VanZ family protein